MDYLNISSPLRETNILIVEDSGIVGMQIKSILSNLGYTIAGIISSGEKAVEIAEEKHLDLVLMDIKLDGILDGIETAKILKQKFDLPVIFITAYSDEETLSRAKISDPFGYILKPFESKELITTVEIALYKHSYEKKLRQSEELYRTLVQTTHDGIIILYNGFIEFINDAVTRMLGYDKDELSGAAFSKLMDKRISSALDDHLEKLAQNNPLQSEYDIELIHKNGTNRVPVMINLNSAFYQNKNIVVCTVKDITEIKKAQEILKQSEENLRAKLEYLLSSSEKVEKVALAELIDPQKLQKIQDAFALSFDIASVITDTDGNPITYPSNFSAFCSTVRSTEIGNQRCIESDRILGQGAKQNKQPSICSCSSGGLTDAAVPLYVAKQHIGNWLIGQINYTETEPGSIARYAGEIGADPQKLSEEFSLIKTMERKKFEQIVKLLSLLSQEISSLAYKNLKLNKELFQRKLTESELKKSEVKNEAILSAIPDSMFQINAEGIYKCLKLSNVPEDCFRGFCNQSKEQNIQLDFPEKVAELILKNVKAVIATHNPQRFEFTVYSGEFAHYYEARAALLGPEETLIMIRDITEKKVSESEIIKAKEKAENSDRLKSEFLAQISHEIRTPINAILSFSSLLKEELENKLSDGLAESFRIIDKAGRRLIRTIDEILEMSQLQTGNYEVLPVEIDLTRDVLENLLSQYYYLAKERQIELKFENKVGGQTLINADRHMINQIFSNLIDNAIKYTPDGEIQVVQYEDEKNNLCVEIRDTGIGISDEYIPKLFTPFSQEDTGYTRRYEGNGLGLAIVKRYAELNNAQINVKSKKGRGTVFTVTFK